MIAFLASSIVAKDAEQFTTDQYDVNSDVYKFYIEKENWEITLDDGTSYETVSQTGERLKFIRDTFAFLDRALALDFAEVKDYTKSDLDINLIDSNSDPDWDDDTLGWWDYKDEPYTNRILWQDHDEDFSTFSTNDKNTIIKCCKVRWKIYQVIKGH